jgi:flagellar biosynthesis protein FlhA
VAQRAGASPPALIVQPRARRALAALLQLRAPGCTVLSINELPAAQPIEVIAVVGGDSEAAPQVALGSAAPVYETEALAA